MSYYPPPAFQFRVAIAGNNVDDDAAFSEVSGLDAEVEVEEIKEGGENAYIHRVPGRVKFNNLVLKRGILVRGSQFSKWCQQVLQPTAFSRVKCHDLDISLLDDAGAPLLTWHCSHAWPVKWSVGPFNSTQNEVAVETMEFAFRHMRRS